MNDSSGMLMALLPVIILNYGLAAYCLVDLIQGGKPRYLPKLAWGFLILFAQILGSAAYLLLGRNHDSAEG